MDGMTYTPPPVPETATREDWQFVAQHAAHEVKLLDECTVRHPQHAAGFQLDAAMWRRVLASLAVHGIKPEDNA